MLFTWNRRKDIDTFINTLYYIIEFKNKSKINSEILNPNREKELNNLNLDKFKENNLLSKRTNKQLENDNNEDIKVMNLQC